MRWQKVARLLVAAVGLGTAIAIYLLTRDPPPRSRPQVATVADPTADAQSAAGQQLRYDGPKLIGTLEFAKSASYPDGRAIWEKFRYKLEDGSVISADVVEAKGSSARGDPAEFTLKGHVRFEGPDRMSLGADMATFNETTGLVNVPGLASFSRGRMSGTGVGGRYVRDAGTFALGADVKVAVAAEGPGAIPLDITSQAMTFTQAARSALFTGNARIARSSETLTADAATLYMTEDEQNFRSIELRSNSRVTPAPGQPSNLPEMQANDIDLIFYEDGAALERGDLRGRALMVLTDQGRKSIEASQIRFSTARDGKTLTELSAGERVTVKTPPGAGIPERMITAQTLAAKGTEKSGLTTATFDSRVEFVEVIRGAQGRADSKRVGTAERLVMAIKGQLDVIDTARFEREVRFTSANVTGTADIGVYRASQGELDLQPLSPKSRRLPHADDGTVIVDATEIITVDLNTNNLLARGDVKTVNQGTSGGPSASGGAIFNSTDPVYGFGAEFRYDSATRQATYMGSKAARARLVQKESEVFGNEVVLLQEKQDLSAKGNVESTLVLTRAEGSKGGRGASSAPVKYRAIADSLVYTEAKRTATYTGAPATLRSTDGETLANTIVLILSKTARALERLEAAANVRTNLQDGREAQGHTLVYETAKDVYVLQGDPLVLTTRDEDGSCSVQQGSYMTFDGAVGAPEFPAARNAKGAPIKSRQPCPPSLSSRK